MGVELTEKINCANMPLNEEQLSSSDSESDSETVGGKMTNVKENRAARMKDRMAKLRGLKTTARKENRAAVQEEDRLAKLPHNHASQQQSAQWKLDEIERKKAAKDKGDDYDLVKLREVQADHAEAKAIKKKLKADPDTGWASWADCTSRQYRRLAKEITPDWRAYQSERERLGNDAFYATLNTQVEESRKDSTNAKNKLAESITAQQEKRAKYHRRRTFNEDDHINFINERNRKFNQKAERAFGNYTSEIRDNIERGTAL